MDAQATTEPSDPSTAVSEPQENSEVPSEDEVVAEPIVRIKLADASDLEAPVYVTAGGLGNERIELSDSPQEISADQARILADLPYVEVVTD